MSGTSLDGIDVVLVNFENDRHEVLAHRHSPFPAELRTELAALNHAGSDEIHRAALAGNALARCYAQATEAVLISGSISADTIIAIGCHGQTVRHRPDAGYTIQLVNAALLAELTGITVACDFRSRDIAAGGEGAPFAPAFHRAAFFNATIHRTAINIGGIANITNLPCSDVITGFDCGPGNGLMDGWTQRHRAQAYDDGGAWASGGTTSPKLLQRLMSDDYFTRLAPKSTGRDLFNMAWLDQHISKNESTISTVDVQATLLELTARTIADAVLRFCSGTAEVYVCGGGAHNNALMQRLATLLAPASVAATDALGVPAEHVEALAFAWLARERVRGAAIDLHSVTGARGPRVLGALYSR